MPLFPHIYTSLNSHSCWGEIGENMQGTLRQNFIFISKKHAECVLKILTFTKGVGNNAYTDFFHLPDRSIVNTKTWQRYINIFCSESVVSESLSFWSKN